MRPRPPRSTRTDTLFPYTTLFRSIDMKKFAGLLPAALLLSAAAHAGETPPPRIVAVDGEGEVSTQPDRARLKLAADALDPELKTSSEERRVGTECVSTCRSRWSPYH